MSQSLVSRDSSGNIRDVDDNNGYPVKLTGRNATQTIMANAVQIRDTLNHYFPGNNTVGYSAVTLLDVSAYAEKGVLVYNGHDQALTVSIHGDARQTPGNSQTRFSPLTSDSLAAGATKWYGSGANAQLKEPFPYLAVQLTASVAPTTGSVSIYLEGGQR